MRITLSTPVQHGETTYQAVTLRQARVRDMIRIADHLPAITALSAEGGKEATISSAALVGMVEIVSTIGDLPVEVVEEFGFGDLVAIMEVAGDFLSFEKSAGAL